VLAVLRVLAESTLAPTTDTTGAASRLDSLAAVAGTIQVTIASADAPQQQASGTGATEDDGTRAGMMLFSLVASSAAIIDAAH
jgi:hypothetical protein